MLETILSHLHNRFIAPGGARRGTFRIVSGMLQADFIENGQYYRIVGSVFNDGLHRRGYEGFKELRDESFTGEIWPLAIPKEVIKLSEEISVYCEKNPETDKVSESFGGYSYTRGTDGNGGVSGGWQAAYRARLNRWKKVG